MYTVNFDLEGNLRISNQFDSEFYINTSFKEVDETYYNEIVYQWYIKDEELYLDTDENSMLYDYICKLDCKEFDTLIQQFIYYSNTNFTKLYIHFNFERDMLMPSNIYYDGSPRYFEEFIKYRPRIDIIKAHKYIIDFEDEFEHINSLIKRGNNIKLIHGINKTTTKKINYINGKIQNKIKDLARNIIINYNYDGKIYGKLVAELYKYFNEIHKTDN